RSGDGSLGRNSGGRSRPAEDPDQAAAAGDRTLRRLDRQRARGRLLASHAGLTALRTLCGDCIVQRKASGQADVSVSPARPDRQMGPLRKARRFIWLLLLAAATGVAAQGRDPLPAQPSAYWRYDAPGPLQMVTTGDLDNDGMQEFVAITEEGQLLLLGADGRNRWTYELREGTPVRHVITLNVEGAVEPGGEVLLVTDDTLLLLDEDRRVMWRRALGGEAAPVGLQPYDHDGDGSEGFLLALSSGILQFYDGGGELVWHFPETPPASDNPLPQLAVGDVDGDGQEEIAYSYYQQYSRLSLLEGNRVVTMARSLSGQVTALTMPALGEGGRHVIAMGKSFRDRHELLVYNESGEELWRRTPNLPITALASGSTPAGEIL